MGTDAHRAAAESRGPVAVAVITVSDSRTPETDTNGQWLHEHIAAAGATVSGYRVVRDEPAEIRTAVDELVADAQVLVVNGGTGVSRRDTTYDTLAGHAREDAARVRRALPDAELGAGRLSRDALARDRRHLPRRRDRLDPRLAEGRCARVGEAPRTGAGAPRLGGWQVAPQGERVSG